MPPRGLSRAEQADLQQLAAVFRGQSVREDGHRAADDGSDARDTRSDRVGFGEAVERLFVAAAVFVHLARLMGAHGTIRCGAALPRQQVRSLVGPFLQQDLDVALGPRQPIHVVTAESRENIFPDERVNG